MTLIDPRASRSLGLQARLNGGHAIALSETTWDVSGRCERPQRVTVEARDYAEFQYDPFWKIYTRQGWFRQESLPVEVPGIGRGHATHLEVRCGKCAACLRARAFMWKERAKTECLRPECARTWFCTLTASPETQLRWSGEAAARLRVGGTCPTSLHPDEWYAERCKQAGQDLTKYVKRIRKYSAAKLRALWVFERHEGGGHHDGLPHIHGLIHEQHGAPPVRYRLLQAEWVHGFSTQKLLTDKSEADSSTVSAYVSKCCGYIAKATTVRIRASRFYGVPQKPSAQTRANRIAPSPAGAGGVENPSRQQREEGTHPQRDAGLDIRARGACNAPGECRAPAVEGSAEGRGENPSPLLGVADPSAAARCVSAASMALRPALHPEGDTVCVINSYSVARNGE